MTAFTIAGVHNMSKRTSVYLGYTAADCDDDMNESFSRNERAYDFSYVKACSGVDDNGGDNERFALGMKHKF